MGFESTPGSVPALPAALTSSPLPSCSVIPKAYQVACHAAHQLAIAYKLQLIFFLLHGQQDFPPLIDRIFPTKTSKQYLKG